jgi:hypothetical protein
MNNPVHRDEQSLPDPSPFEVEITIANLKRYKSPGKDEFPSTTDSSRR